jgi:RNA polymerase sigma-70 factor (ECF subfamily)
VGRHHSHGGGGCRRGAPGDRCQGPGLNDQFSDLFRQHWWAAVAQVARTTGDLSIAEDAVQDACGAALAQWPVTGLPANPGAWLRQVARHKAIDRLRREALREEKESAARRLDDEEGDPPPMADDELAVIFLCCHPALDPTVQVPMTLRSVCGLTTGEIAAAFLVPEATMAKRLVRAKRKIRQSSIPLRVPPADELGPRLDAVLRVVYLVYTEGHRATTGDELTRPALCDTALRLARELRARLPDQPEVTGLLALLLLTDARRGARTDPEGQLVVLEEQDRGLWDAAMIAEGEALLEGALRQGRPGPYQLWAAISACHSTAPVATDTDWRQIAALYRQLLRYEPTAVVEANRAVAVAMAEGPAAGLVILDEIAVHPQLARWPQLHIARADLLRRIGRTGEAVAAYRLALQLEPPVAERSFIHRRLRQLQSDCS